MNVLMKLSAEYHLPLYMICRFIMKRGKSISSGIGLSVCVDHSSRLVLITFPLIAGITVCNAEIIGTDGRFQSIGEPGVKTRVVGQKVGV